MTGDLPETPPIRVDIVSDVVCPWCIVGYKQLERALALYGEDLALQVRWHPFELNPQMPAEGQELKEHVAEKYGSTAEQSDAVRQRLTDLGEELGFDFRYYDGMRIVNTFQAHQLLHWAGPSGRQHALKMALFEAYFTRQERVDDPEVLVTVAKRAGLEGAEAAKVLQEGPLCRGGAGGRGLLGPAGHPRCPGHGLSGALSGLGRSRRVENYLNILRQLASNQAA